MPPLDIRGRLLSSLFLTSAERVTNRNFLIYQALLKTLYDLGLKQEIRSCEILYQGI